MKRFALIFVLLVVSSIAYAQNSFFQGEGGKNHTIMFSESTLENGLYDKTDIWITDKIKANLISVLQRYGGFNCVDMEETKSIMKIQKQLETSSAYDDSLSIEVGKLIKAKEFITIKTTRYSSGAYSIHITLFNVETGAILGVFSSPIIYASSEEYVMQAHYDCLLNILTTLGIQQTPAGKAAFEDEVRSAKEQAAKNKQIAQENAKNEAERAEKAMVEAERRRKIEAEEREEQERREAKEKAEMEAVQKALEEKKAREAELAREIKRQNPFVGSTYYCAFENGSRYDTYTIEFTSQNECMITMSSTDSKGTEKSVTKKGSYSYANEILSVNANMTNDQVKHIQKIQWKGQVSFKNEYNTFYLMIPVSSSEGAKKIKSEFQLK